MIISFKCKEVIKCLLNKLKPVIVEATSLQKSKLKVNLLLVILCHPTFLVISDLSCVAEGCSCRKKKYNF